MYTSATADALLAACAKLPPTLRLRLFVAVAQSRPTETPRVHAELVQHTTGSAHSALALQACVDGVLEAAHAWARSCPVFTAWPQECLTEDSARTLDGSFHLDWYNGAPQSFSLELPVYEPSQRFWTQRHVAHAIGIRKARHLLAFLAQPQGPCSSWIDLDPAGLAVKRPLSLVVADGYEQALRLHQLLASHGGFWETDTVYDRLPNSPYVLAQVRPRP